MDWEENITPAMSQYYEIKKKYTDCIVFFRMWDFYEMFGEDAHTAHKVLWINITSRNKNAKEPIPLAGIPYHAKEKYLPKLVEAGYKVAIVEQISDPKLKWIVKREVTRIVTPSTLTLESESFDEWWENTYIVSLIEENNTFSLSTINISDNEWKVYETNNLEFISQLLFKIYPKELILERNYNISPEIEKILKWKSNISTFFHTIPNTYTQHLKNHFGCINLIPFWLEEKKLAQKSSSLLLSYLEENQKWKLPFLTSVKVEDTKTYMELDESTLKSLDIFYNFSTKSELQWTLLWVFSKTKTSWGKRTMRKNFLHPLKNKNDIEERLNFVEELKKSPIILTNIREQLSCISDIDSILNRISLNRTNPRDLLSLKKSLESILHIQKIITEQGSEPLKSIFSKLLNTPSQ